MYGRATLVKQRPCFLSRRFLPRRYTHVYMHTYPRCRIRCVCCCVAKKVMYFAFIVQKKMFFFSVFISFLCFLFLLLFFLSHSLCFSVFLCVLCWRQWNTQKNIYTHRVYIQQFFSSPFLLFNKTMTLHRSYPSPLQCIAAKLREVVRWQ